MPLQLAYHAGNVGFERKRSQGNAPSPCRPIVEAGPPDVQLGHGTEGAGDQSKRVVVRLQGCRVQTELFKMQNQRAVTGAGLRKGADSAKIWDSGTTAARGVG